MTVAKIIEMQVTFYIELEMDRNCEISSILSKDRSNKNITKKEKANTDKMDNVFAKFISDFAKSIVTNSRKKNKRKAYLL